MSPDVQGMELVVLPAKRALPLAGTRVLDLTQAVSGPLATQTLADFGAHVTKIEQPGQGDVSRISDPESDGIEDSSCFVTLNRNKYSVALELNHPRTHDIIHRMLETTDVLVSSFEASHATALGLEYEQLREKYPRLIYASIQGLPQTPLETAVGEHDAILQSMTGAAWHNRDTHGHPLLNRSPYLDFGTGMALVQGILLALLERSSSGEGQRVDISKLHSALFFQAQEYTQWMLRRTETNRDQDTIAATFKTDDSWITVVGLSRPNTLRAVCVGLGIADLTDVPEFSTPALQAKNRAALREILGEQFINFCTDNAVDKLRALGVSCGPVQTYDDVLAHPLVVRKNLFCAIGNSILGPTNVIDSPIKLSAGDKAPYFPAPQLGQHTTQTLEELGYTTQQIQGLAEEGLVGRGYPSLA